MRVSLRMLDLFNGARRGRSQPPPHATAAGRHLLAPPAGHATRRRPSVPVDPLTSLTMRRYLATRAGDVSVAIEDLDEPLNTPGRSDAKSRSVAKSRSEAAIRSDKSADYHEWLFHPNARDETASIIKVDILETLLHQSRGALSYDARVTAEGMIDDSDNDDATDLWNADGGGYGVAAYNRAAGLTQTSPNIAGYWGLTLTSAADQIKLLTRARLSVTRSHGGVATLRAELDGAHHPRSGLGGQRRCPPQRDRGRSRTAGCRPVDTAGRSTASGGCVATVATT